MFAIISLYLPLIFSNGVRRHVVVYDKYRFQPEIICNAVCTPYRRSQQPNMLAYGRLRT